MICPHSESSKQHALAGAYQQQLVHLLEMARQPAWKAYAWSRAQELDKTPPFEGIAADLITEMKKGGVRNEFY